MCVTAAKRLVSLQGGTKADQQRVCKGQKAHPRKWVAVSRVEKFRQTRALIETWGNVKVVKAESGKCGAHPSHNRRGKSCVDNQTRCRAARS